MWTCPLPAPAAPHPRPPAGAPAAASTGFQDVLAAAKGVTKQSLDEDRAARELLHLLASLSIGVVDPSVLSEASGSTGDDLEGGPIRRQVEALKEVLRRVMRQEIQSEGDLDPATGKPRPGRVSLQALLDSLPDDLRNLVRKAFPDLDALLQSEAEHLNGPATQWPPFVEPPPPPVQEVWPRT